MVRGTPKRRGKALLWLLLTLLIGGGIGVGSAYLIKLDRGDRGGDGNELDLVPTDAVAFVHVRARGIWYSPDMADLRSVINKAGPDALKMLDDGFIPKPSTLDTLTVVVLKDPNAPKPPKKDAPDNPGGPPVAPPPPPPIQFPEHVVVVGILSFTEDFDAAQVRTAYMPEAIAKTANGKEYWADEKKDIGAYFPNGKTLVIGEPDGVAVFVTQQTDGERSKGPLSGALELARSGRDQLVAGVNAQSFFINPAGLVRQMSDLGSGLFPVVSTLRPVLLADAFSLGISLDGDASHVELRGYYRDGKTATAAEEALRAAAKAAREPLGKLKEQHEKTLKGKPDREGHRPIKELPDALFAYVGIGGLNTLDELLANPPLSVEGNQVVLSADRSTLVRTFYAGYTAIFGTLFGEIMPFGETADRMRSTNNLKQIGLAMHNYESSYGRFPMPAWTEGAGGPKPGGLSWRVHILPYIEQENLYKKFKLDEPWDSEHNKALIPLMPQVYASPSASAEPGKTYYKVLVSPKNATGPTAAFVAGQQGGFVDFSDGTSNTILAVEGGGPVIWTKPDDIPYDAEEGIEPLSLSLEGNPEINVLLCDGSVRALDMSNFTADTLKNLLTRNGGEIVDFSGEGLRVPAAPKGGPNAGGFGGGKKRPKKP